MNLLGGALAGGGTGVGGHDALGSRRALESGARIRLICGEQVAGVSRLVIHQHNGAGENERDEAPLWHATSPARTCRPHRQQQ